MCTRTARRWFPSARGSAWRWTPTNCTDTVSGPRSTGVDRHGVPTIRQIGWGKKMFRRSGGHCVATFAHDEVRVLRKVAAEVVGLLTEGMDHTDPVVSRLFPDIYPDRPEDSQEFRLYTEGDLKTSKIDQA